MKNFNPVINLNTLQIFENNSSASKHTGCNRTSISKCCHNTLNHCLDKDGHKTKWSFASDFIEEYGSDFFFDNCYFHKVSMTCIMGGTSKYERF